MPGLSDIKYPLVNGHRYSWSSIENKINNFLMRGLKSIDYDDGLDPGMMRGAGVAVQGRTRGQYEANASCEMYRLEFDAFVLTLGANGYGEKSFDWTISYADVEQPVVTDTLGNLRIKKVSNALAEGNEAAVVKVEFSMIYLLRNGACLYDTTRL